MIDMLNVAIEAAKAGGTLAANYFKSNPKYILKKDKSPVTKADIETEKLIRKIISKKFPNHGIIGEELKPDKPDSEYLWIIDPIDGTRDYVRKIPYWAVFIACMVKQVPQIGVIYFPVLGDLIYAQKGKGTYVNGKKVRVSSVKDLKKTTVSFGSIKRIAEGKQFNLMKKIAQNTQASRSYGNLGIKFFLEGKLDLMVEFHGAIHDYAAPSIIVEEAGGKFTNFDGKFDLASGKAILSNGHVHSQILKIINQSI